MAKNILIVEDEAHLIEALKLNLEIEGYEVTTTTTGTAALQAVKNGYFDLILLDIMLPEIDGFTITETIRVQQNYTPILILSAKNTSEAKINGLKKGADDYLTKPFNLEELLLRINKLIDKNDKINKPENAQLNTYTFGKNTITFDAMEAINFENKLLKLSKKEAMLLKLLIENKNQVVTREKILQTVWGYSIFPNTRTIDNFILNFRKYFEEDTKSPKHIHSIRGLGYKFTA